MEQKWSKRILTFFDPVIAFLDWPKA